MWCRWKASVALKWLKVSCLRPSEDHSEVQLASLCKPPTRLIVSNLLVVRPNQDEDSLCGQMTFCVSIFEKQCYEPMQNIRWLHQPLAGCVRVPTVSLFIQHWPKLLKSTRAFDTNYGCNDRSGPKSKPIVFVWMCFVLKCNSLFKSIDDWASWRHTSSSRCRHMLAVCAETRQNKANIRQCCFASAPQKQTNKAPENVVQDN